MRRLARLLPVFFAMGAAADVPPPQAEYCEGYDPGDRCVDGDGAAGICQYGCAGHVAYARRRLRSSSYPALMCLGHKPPRLTAPDCVKDMGPPVPEPGNDRPRRAGERCRGGGGHRGVYADLYTHDETEDGQPFYVHEMECLPENPRLCSRDGDVGKECDLYYGGSGTCQKTRCAKRGFEAHDESLMDLDPRKDLVDCVACVAVEDPGKKKKGKLVRLGGPAVRERRGKRLREPAPPTIPLVSPSTSPTPAPTAPKAESRGSGGCSLAPAASLAGAWPLLALALVLAVRRRRAGARRVDDGE